MFYKREGAEAKCRTRLEYIGRPKCRPHRKKEKEESPIGDI